MRRVHLLRDVVIRIGGLTLALGFGLGSPVDASTVRRLNIEELTLRATTIVHARCVTSSVEADALLGREVQVATFDVVRAVKGDPGARLTIRLPGPEWVGIAAGDGLGLPAFGAGDETVLFLYGTSRLGLTSTVGLGQGRFVVVDGKASEKIVVAPIEPSTLLRGLSAPALGKLGELEPRWRDGRVVSPDRLLDAVEALSVGR